jgi:hypothetical protein
MTSSAHLLWKDEKHCYRLRDSNLGLGGAAV